MAHGNPQTPGLATTDNATVDVDVGKIKITAATTNELLTDILDQLKTMNEILLDKLS